MIDHLSPKQVAQALGVSEASVKRWCDQRVFETTRTVGGHRRVSTRSVIAYLRRARQAHVRPQALGLPEIPGGRGSDLRRAAPLLATALSEGDDERVRSVAFGLYLAGYDLPAILDRGLTPAFTNVGECREKENAEVYRERRACEIGTRILHQLRGVTEPPLESAPVACGGTLTGDPYTIPTTMVELTLRSIGWRAESYGAGLPAATLRTALLRERPRLLWISVSSFPSEEAFVAEFESLSDAARSSGVAVVVGGRGLTESVAARVRFTCRCDSMSQLADFARVLYERTPDDRSPRE